MQLAKLLVYFDTSPALSLLRSSNAPFIIDFLNQLFKQSERISWAHSELVTALIAYQENLQETDPGKLPSRADAYLAEWCSSETRWLRRFLEADADEPSYQLTPHTEDVFAFLDLVLGKDLNFVGTESRLKLVIDLLANLVVGSSDDPETRLQHLRNEQKKIQDEITQIEQDGVVATYRPDQIRDQFATAVSILKQLQGDFRAVEESFRDITLEVQQQQVAGLAARGGILEYALNAEDVLKKDDQGVSFYEFVNLILSPVQTEQLERIIAEIRKIPELSHQQEGMETVRGMVTLLQREAEKVMRTNQRLSTTLRRLLDMETHAERQRVAHLLQEIRGLVISLGDQHDCNDVGLTVEVNAAVDSPFRRTFWTEPTRLEVVDLTEFQPDEAERTDVFKQYAAMHRLDWNAMRTQIDECLKLRSAPTLADVLDEYPPTSGAVEVLGYLQIAKDDNHHIDETVEIPLSIPPIQGKGNWIEVRVPLVTFLNKRRNGHA
ncbi:DUF3375 domain-containing protein [Thalassoglobus polymorphus]|uniref:DUF3375 domain-containing protein n=1 Tax=Thalassoglobus polymorphus TaxID=2527994 RepID=A0A517QKQ3_9PLAN|nr:DUF3375 domain-containing protein [Thalassoglobus polymorphus]QDT32220.1 hypothetical protein Mal48_14630 [Thalassoglobus polymorphus]